MVEYYLKDYKNSLIINSQQDVKKDTFIKIKFPKLVHTITPRTNGTNADQQEEKDTTKRDYYCNQHGSETCEFHQDLCLDGNDADPKAGVIVLVLLVAVNLLLDPLNRRLVGYKLTSSVSVRR